MRPNYAERQIPIGAGLYLVMLLPAILTLAMLAGVRALPLQLNLVFSLAVLGFGLAGLVDDLLGGDRDKGFRGHFGALFRERRLTSGALKALFGVVVSIFIALALRFVEAKLFGPWYQVLLNTLLLASAANLINLFDLRPGRAGKVYLLALLICAAVSHAGWLLGYGGPILLYTVMFLPLFRRDLRAQLMLGDVGANALGAVLGLAMVFWLTPRGKIVALLILLGLQLLSERFSFSALIERQGFLRLLDRLGRRSEE